ncbi:MAG: polysaccharide biosynthesis C-terminal domain-containing protein, partial [Defluviitaleaceae bacterium]|nr:polysaccharide biosynthesis C-terminal domain-containing protein [Defluviitaleaceae bacterium]
ISASFIPVFNSFLERKGRRAAFELGNNFISVVVMAAALATAIIAFGADWIAAFWLSNREATPALISLAAQLLRIMSLTIILTSVAFALTGIVQSLGEFNIPALMSLLSNIIIMGYLMLFGNPGVVGLVIAFVIGNISQVIIIIPPLIKRGYRFGFFVRLKDDGIKQIFKLTPMVLIGSWLFPINNQINSIVTNRYDMSATLQFRAANTLYIVISGVFILSLSNVLFPKLSRQAAANSDIGKSGKKDGFSETLISAIRAMLIILIPMAAGLAILAAPIIRLFYLGGNSEFTEIDAVQSAFALRLLTIGMIGFGLQTILSRAFYSQMDGKTPMFISLIAILINFACVIIGVNYLGVGGAALASSVSINIAGIIMLIIMHRRKHILNFDMLLLFVKTLVCATAMSAVALLCIRFFENAILAIFAAATSGILVYFAMAYLLRIPEVFNATKAVRAFLQRRK